MFAKADKRVGVVAGLSIIGPDMVVTGDIATDGDLHIDGEVKGDIRCAGLTQGEKGRVSGNVTARDARIAGRVDGTVSAATLSIEKSALVSGDLNYETLNIDRGARVDGRFTHQSSSGAAPIKLISAAE